MVENRASGELDPKVYAQQRQHMVQTQLYRRGIRDRAVLEAFRQVLRQYFVPVDVRTQAYSYYPLPI